MNKHQQRQQKIQRQQALVNGARSANRSLNESEQAEFDTLQREIDQLTAEIAAEERQGAPATPAAPATGDPAPTASGLDDQQRAIQAERSRVTEITNLCRDFDVDPATYISGGNTVDQVRTAIVDQLRSQRGPIRTGTRVDANEDETFRRDAVDGMLIRGGVTLENPSRQAQELASMSMRDLAIECLERSGVQGARRMSSETLFQEVLTRQFYNPTSAFPTILDNAINKAYVQGHKTAAVTFDRWTKKGNLKDFKVHDNNYLAGPIGDFLEVPEGGELKHDKPTDAKLPTRKLKTYGKQFTLSRQAFINDDIELVTGLPARYAAAARRTINTQCYKILMENPNIYDGTPLFSAKHGNLVKTGTGITMASMQAMIMALSTQKDQFDQPIIIRPAAIIVPAGYAFEMFTLFNSPTINTEGNTQAVNPLYQYRTAIEIIEDPTINALAGGFGKVMPWWLIGNRDDTAFIEVDYLNGNEIPIIRRMETPGQLGFVWDVYHDWGINVMDFRGAIKNPGVVINNPLG